MNYTRLAVFIGLAVIAVMAYYFGADYITFEWLQAKSTQFKLDVEQHYTRSALIFMASCAGVVMITLPIVIPLTLLAGFLFGTWTGALYITIAATIGSIVSFLMFRYVFNAILKKHFGARFDHFNQHIQKNGINYLLMLHYSSLVPFFVINSLAALTNMHFLKFVAATILGLFPTSLIYAFAGRQLGSIKTVGDIFSPEVVVALGALITLAFVPVLVKKYKNANTQV